MIRDEFKNLISQNKSMLTTMTSGLFEDSLSCFDAGIYRQSYILAYQGFIQHFKALIQNATIPIGYDVHKWNELQSKLNDDGEFDHKYLLAFSKRQIQELPLQQ